MVRPDVAGAGCDRKFIPRGSGRPKNKRTDRAEVVSLFDQRTHAHRFSSNHTKRSRQQQRQKKQPAAEKPRDIEAYSLDVLVAIRSGDERQENTPLWWCGVRLVYRYYDNMAVSAMISYLISHLKKNEGKKKKWRTSPEMYGRLG